MNKEELKQIIMTESKELEDYIIKQRRHFHMHPETAFEEKNTAKYIEEELNTIGYNTIRTAQTGLIALLDSGKPGKTIGLRADIDALDVPEENDVEYCSKNKGKMHACGHDAHTSMLLGAAKIIFKHKDKLTGKLKLIFQPAEEGGGGAKKIVDEGHIDDIDEIFGIHVWADLETGIVGTRVGPFLASADKFEIIIEGKGGHAASPHQTFDSTAVLVDIYNALQKVVSREINPLDNAVISTPKFIGSDTHNVIPAKAELWGTFRTFNTEVRDHIIKRMNEIVEGYSHAWRCKGTVNLSEIYYPPTINHEDSVERALKILDPLKPIATMGQTMGGEDFAFYLNKTKGAFFTLGIRNEDKGIIYPHHHPKFDVDEAVLWKGAATYALLAFANQLEE